jgi:hypothetical protein
VPNNTRAFTPVWAAVSQLARQSLRGDGGTSETNAPSRKRVAASTRPTTATLRRQHYANESRKMPPRDWPARMSGRLAPSCVQRLSGRTLRGIVTDLTAPASGSVLRRQFSSAWVTYATVARGTDCRNPRNCRQVIVRITRKYPTRSARKTIAMWRGRAKPLERPRPMRRREIQPFRTR